MKETIVFVERRDDGIVEFARFDGSWHGEKGMIEILQAELAYEGVDIMTAPPEAITFIFHGSYSWAYIAQEEPIPVIPQT